jgi:hypothetical protein
MMVPVAPVEFPAAMLRRMRASDVLLRLRAENERLRELVASQESKKQPSVCSSTDSVMVSIAYLGAPLIARKGTRLGREVAPTES